jgi:hypothetical protein
VLEALEASIDAHPASGRREQGTRSDTISRDTRTNVLRLVRHEAPTDTPDAA